MKYLVFIFSLFQLASTSGLLDIHLKSAHDQSATLTLTDEQLDTEYLRLPIKISKNEEFKFEDILVDFNTTYSVKIILNETPKLGLAESIYTGTVNPARGASSPETLNLPLTGMMFEFKCQENWTGEKCDVRCDKNCTEPSKTINDMEFDVSYTVNPMKLETIVAMLKKDNEVANTLSETRKEEEQLLEEVMEGSGEHLLIN